MVLPVVGALAAAVKVNYSRTVVDTLTARIHYRWTTTLCLLCAAFVMAADFVGDSISCILNADNAPKYMETYCWITSTFSVINSSAPISGLGVYNEEIHEKKVHTYYQWVPLVLAIMAGLFYLPHYLWKQIEGKQVDNLLQGLGGFLFDDTSDQKIKIMIDYLRESFGLNVKYYFGHFCCECLYLVNAITQMVLLDKFFNGAFTSYGTRVFSMLRSDEGKNSVFLEVFPKVAKCIFYSFGSSGSPQKHDLLCVLPQNIINEKIFLVLWLWLVILTAITCLQIVWLVVTYSSVSVRGRIMSYLIRTDLPMRMKQALRHMHIGDFCLLASIGYNLEVKQFRKVMEGVTEASEIVFAPNAPDYGSYRPFENDATAMETLPRRRNVYPPLS